MRLSECTNGRNNNFNLLRIIAAFSVLVAHSYALTSLHEPSIAHLGIDLGQAAVDLFFVTSGFLVTSSLLRTQNTAEFICARALRIYPALWIVLLLSVVLLGPVFTVLPLSLYAAGPQTYIYFCRCATLLFGVSFTLPGVFAHNPFPRSINGSLWTLPDEVRVYAILALTSFLLRKRPDLFVDRFRTAVGALTILSAFAIILSTLFFPDQALSARHFYMFFAGGLFFSLRERVVLSPRIFWSAVLALIASSINAFTFLAVYMLVLPYVLLFLVYVPGGFIRLYNQLGDYSYGIYIYAFPVQQIIIASTPGITALKVTLIASPITVSLAVLSWHLIEKRALQQKHYVMNRTERFFSDCQRLLSGRLRR